MLGVRYEDGGPCKGRCLAAAGPTCLPTPRRRRDKGCGGGRLCAAVVAVALILALATGLGVGIARHNAARAAAAAQAAQFNDARGLARPPALPPVAAGGIGGGQHPGGALSGPPAAGPAAPGPAPGSGSTVGPAGAAPAPSTGYISGFAPGPAAATVGAAAGAAGSAAGAAGAAAAPSTGYISGSALGAGVDAACNFSGARSAPRVTPDSLIRTCAASSVNAVQCVIVQRRQAQRPLRAAAAASCMRRRAGWALPLGLAKPEQYNLTLHLEPRHFRPAAAAQPVNASAELTLDVMRRTSCLVRGAARCGARGASARLRPCPAPAPACRCPARGRRTGGAACAPAPRPPENTTPVLGAGRGRHVRGVIERALADCPWRAQSTRARGCTAAARAA